jgi:transcriptional regulator with XRE-family HTH domain
MYYPLSWDGNHGGIMAEKRQWFYDRLRDHNLSLRKLARMLGVDPSALTRAFQGRRRITMPEAVEIARIFSVPLEDVYHAAGMVVPAGAETVPMVGTVGPDMVVQPLTTHVPPVAAPPGMPVTAEAIQFRTAASSADLWDRWIAFYDPRPAQDIVGRLCLVTLADSTRHVRSVRAGYLPRTYNLISPFAPTIENVVIAEATPILWMQQP